MTEQNQKRGILMMIAATFVFAVQDGISRHLAGSYNVWMVVMIRYWFFALFVIALAARQPGGLRAATRSGKPLLQIIRGLLLAAEVCVCVIAFVKLGLVETQSVFICYPLIVAALSGPVLGEKVGWRRWCAIGAGFVGILIILKPSSGVFSPLALLPLAAALGFATYALLTRYVSRVDSASVSFFWTGIAGAALMSCIGIWFWQPMAAGDWFWMGCLCLTACLGHFLMIKAYELAEASAIQPFAYLQLLFVTIIAISLFGESLRTNVAIGTVVVVGAGLFTLWRTRKRELEAAAS